MSLRTLLVALALPGLAGAACSGPGDGVEPFTSLPPVAGPDAPGLPPLPQRSPRNASYTIEARLDPEKRTIEGQLVLEWRNTSDQALSSFPFHLYWNAFRNNRSTTATGDSRRWSQREMTSERSFGWTEIRRIERLGEAAEDLTPTLRHLHPDGNEDDRTVIEVRTDTAVEPGETVRFRIAWDSRVPHGTVGRAGWVHDYHFIAQWFPKIGVFWKGEWNCHPFYPWTEFFADFGVYDVRLTVPEGFVLGATGRLEEKTANGDGTETHRYVQEDVHDFTWAASRRFLDRKGTFDDPGYPPVEIRLLLQPEHASLAERYIEATRVALRTYGTWSVPYPYPQVTVVDPAWGSSSGGMEYPTLFTGGARVLSPIELHRPESVTVHEAGHQFWYGLVATNEFEEAWLDEGFNTYMTGKALDHAYAPKGWGRYYFGGSYGRGAVTGWPVLAPEVWIPRGGDRRGDLRADGEKDVMAVPAWTYRDRNSYGTNSYDKPALVLQTLEGLLGDETMVRVLRTWARRYMYAHPTTEDFIGVVGEVTGEDWRWFFEETFFSSGRCDYGVKVDVRRTQGPRGWFEAPDGSLELADGEGEGEGWTSKVTVIRHEAVRMPVEVQVELSDGRVLDETWDGQDRWTRFEYTGARVVRATVDPGGKIAIDVQPANNEWIEERGTARRAATKWAMRWMFWLQDLLELQMVVG